MYIHPHSQAHNQGEKSLLILERKALIVFLMKCLSKCPISTNPSLCPEKFLVAHLHSGIILFAKRFILHIWAAFWIHLSRKLLSKFSDLMLCTTSDTLRIILAYLALCFFQVYSIILALLKQFHSYWDIIEGYSGLFRYIEHPLQGEKIRRLLEFGIS